MRKTKTKPKTYTSERVYEDTLETILSSIHEMMWDIIRDGGQELEVIFKQDDEGDSYMCITYTK